MQTTKVSLKALTKGGYRADIRYLVRGLRIILKCGVFPKNLSSMVATEEKTTSAAVRKGYFRISRTIWDNSVGILHEEGEKCPLPLEVLHELAYVISDGEIL